MRNKTRVKLRLELERLIERAFLAGRDSSVTEEDSYNKARLVTTMETLDYIMAEEVNNGLVEILQVMKRKEK